MTDLYIYLSGSWPKSIKADSVRDHVLVGPGRNVPEGFKQEFAVKSLSVKQCNELAKQLIFEFNLTGENAGRSILECFLNDYYSYTLKSVFSILSSIEDCLRSSAYSNIYIVSAATNIKYPPMVGFKTTESNRGSANLLGAYTASIVPLVFKTYSFKKISTKGDILCNNYFRSILVIMANKLFGMLLLLKVAIINISVGENKKSGVRSFVLIRNEHQARFAAIVLARSGGRLGAVVFPQASQGSFGDLRKCLSLIPEGVKTFNLSLKGVFVAYKLHLKDLNSLSDYKHSIATHRFLTLNGISLPFDFRGLCNEINMVSVVVLYKNILRRLLLERSPANLINFELVGRMAGLEALAAREVGVQSHSIQTALVSAIAQPVFPFSDKFYADGAIGKGVIEDIGFVKKGKVVFDGSILEMKKQKNPAKFKSIGYFTQPYESFETIDILNILASWAKSQKSNLIIKLHPRDSLERYKDFLLRNDFITVFRGSDVQELIDTSDLVVTRTSSVAKEALAAGCPLILTLWSSLDRNVRADYLVKKLQPSYCAENKEEIVALLDKPSIVIDASKELRKCLFSDGAVDGLVKKLIDL